MELGSPVILISAFGRGHWLAAALAKEGIKTTLVDVSSKLGVWPSEDVEGPFGFLRNERVSESQLERLYADDPYDEVSNGFTLWLKEGPFEFKGPVSKYKLDQSSLAAPVKEIIAGSSADKAAKNLYKHLEALSFDQSWILHLAHQWAGTTYAPNARGASVGAAVPLSSSFLVRQATRNGLEKSLTWLASKGVEVMRPHQIMDVSFGGGKSITGLELSGEKQGLFRLEQIIWMLSSEETYFLNERLGKYFFPEGALEPEWCWVRYRVGLQQCFERDRLPLHTLVVDDLSSPWTHENMMVLQRTSLADQFDVWMRIPTVQRFNKEYLTVRSDRMKKLLTARMSLSEPQILSFPQEYYYTYAQLGASRFPVFGEKQTSRRGRAGFGNLHLDGPEVWPHYSWGAYFDNHERIQLQIVNWWKEKLLKEQKEKKRKEQNP
ncbi:hypothetical protein AB1A81_08890 [Bdellovibrio bacteriovorus]|uniref:Uncharacterized protein n=1 Tax=Bdellovibrio bacteriovorus (strain ATCC 15356 / DSM 50701 / NCIMB 9529 / HD100) TaxID=264462 RepID=Q6MLQ9_BDEBA|nr:hypothetical protein [Bdellovibrio bacteriovorus]CAE79798.1 hypothetical protein predicted by Glimmer/Critica [Bdellovibrio bacteriovorus HD100]